MSHFAVLVIGDNIEEQLAPYQENNMGDCPKEFLKFFDVTDKYLKEYETETHTKLIGPKGDMHDVYDQKFANPDYKIFGPNDNTNKRYIVPEGYEEREVPVKEIYPTFEKYMEASGYEAKVDETGRYGYWENPNKKWDYYRIGGRFAGSLKLKAGATGVSGERGWDAPKNAAPGFVDQALVKDIDFEGMREKRLADRTTWWDEFQAAIKKDPKSEAWERMNFGIKEGQTRESYIAEGEHLSAFAVVKDGKWYEKGKMGWWAIVSDEKDADAWRGQMADLMKDLPEDTLLTFVDCHI